MDNQKCEVCPNDPLGQEHFGIYAPVLLASLHCMFALREQRPFTSKDRRIPTYFEFTMLTGCFVYESDCEVLMHASCKNQDMFFRVRQVVLCVCLLRN